MMAFSVQLKVICIILALFVSSEFGLGYEVAQDNSCRKVIRQVPDSATAKKDESNSQSNVGYEVCARVCGPSGCITYYCPGDSICCTPGSPESKCCPADHPLCLPEGCCPKGEPKICGKYCCEEESVCCKNGEHCCKTKKACCGKEQCCPKEAPCCKQDGLETCCIKDIMACCDGYGCVSPCESQFDAIGCQLSSLSLDAKHWEDQVWEESPQVPRKKLYRILRPDEKPEKGLIAKDPKQTRSVLSHVNCGSRPTYTSQYISTTASLEVAKYYKKKGEEKGLKGLRIAEIDVATLPKGYTMVDLTTDANRQEYLGKAVCKEFAKKSEEVLLQSDVPIPCKVIDPPPEHAENFVDSRREL